MIRLASPICTLAALALTGCTHYYDPPPAPAGASAAVPVVKTAPAAVSPGSFRPGTGIVESISLVNAPASPSGGGTQPGSGPYRVSLRMDDGLSQTLVVDTRAILVGDRLQVTPEGRLIRY